MDDYDDVRPGRDEVDEPVALVMSPSGGALFMPRSLARLKGEEAEVVAHIQRTASGIHDAQTELAELVLEARELGVSWGAIGWSVGTTSEAARQRWGGRQ